MTSDLLPPPSSLPTSVPRCSNLIGYGLKSLISLLSPSHGISFFFFFGVGQARRYFLFTPAPSSFGTFLANAAKNLEVQILRFIHSALIDGTDVHLGTAGWDTLAGSHLHQLTHNSEFHCGRSKFKKPEAKKTRPTETNQTKNRLLPPLIIAHYQRSPLKGSRSLTWPSSGGQAQRFLPRRRSGP